MSYGRFLMVVLVTVLISATPAAQAVERIVILKPASQVCADEGMSTGCNYVPIPVEITVVEADLSKSPPMFRVRALVKNNTIANGWVADSSIRDTLTTDDWNMIAADKSAGLFIGR